MPWDPSRSYEGAKLFGPLWKFVMCALKHSEIRSRAGKCSFASVFMQFDFCGSS